MSLLGLDGVLDCEAHRALNLVLGFGKCTRSDHEVQPLVRKLVGSLRLNSLKYFFFFFCYFPLIFFSIRANFWTNPSVRGKESEKCENIAQSRKKVHVWLCERQLKTVKTVFSSFSRLQWTFTTFFITSSTSFNLWCSPS